MSKDEFISILKNSGLDADYANSGIPTVFVKQPGEIAPAAENVMMLADKSGYTQSYGIKISKAVKENAI